MTLETGEMKEMRDLNVGDRALVSGGSFSPIYFFTHRISNDAHEFVKISTETRSISLTASH